MNRYELLIRRSRSVEPPAPAIPTDYVFYMPLTDADNPEELGGKTMVKYGSPTSSVVDGMSCVRLPDSSAYYLCSGTETGTALPAGKASFTQCVWINIENWSNKGAFFAFGTNSTYKAIHLQGQTQGNINGGGWYLDYSFNYAFQLNTWYFLCQTYDAEQNLFTSYVDGVQTNTSSSMSVNIGTGGVGIGIQASNNEEHNLRPLNVKAARIYDRVLTLDEISALAGEFDEHSDSSSESQSDPSSSDQSDSSSSDIGTIPTDYDWYTPFTTDYTEVKSNITGVPTSNGICSIVSDSRFGGYLNMNKTSSGSLTGLEYPGTQGALAYGNGAFAISYWLNAPSWNSYGQAIISHRGNGTGFDNKNGFVIFKDTSYTMDMRIGSSSMQCKSFSVQTNDTWHHCLYQRNAEGTWGWYEDGVLKTSGTGWNTGHDATSNANVNVMIGGDGDWGKSAVFKMCRLRIYNRALSALEIQALASEF